MEIKEFLDKINLLSRRKVMVEFVQKENEAIISTKGATQKYEQRLSFYTLRIILAENLD